MKIGIVTVYESITNLGSFLQTYALKHKLELLGHDVYVIQNQSSLNSVKKCIFKINPKREILLRYKKSVFFLKDINKLKLVNKNKLNDVGFDLLIYGSDEIWNLDNPYFNNPLFWGVGVKNISKIAYAVSIGALDNNTAKKNSELVNEINDFQKILPRDERTKKFVENIINKPTEIVCDPTILLPLKYMEESIKLPNKKYMVVYTYGISIKMQKIIVEFARKNDLLIVSPCFWHPWVDKVIECSALQFSSLIKNAKYAFTTTFHGAIFTLLNHKQCCILPLRSKVRDVVSRLGEEKYIIDEECSIEKFDQIINQTFDIKNFENNLIKWRKYSENKLMEAIGCIEK